MFAIFITVSANGRVMYSTIEAFLEKQPNMVTEYRSIATVNETLILTGNHLVYARRSADDQFNPM